MRIPSPRCRPVWLALALLTGCAAPPAPPAQHGFDLEAHRGARALAPENTLGAFTHAMQLGVTTLELDIGLTADDVVVISHDTALNPDHTRDAGGAWLRGTGPAIRSMSLAQLQTYDVGRLNPASDYGKPFASQKPADGERIPTLGSLFALARARGAGTPSASTSRPRSIPPRPDETAAPEQMVRALLAEIDKAGMARRVTIQSFDWRTLALVGELAPELPRAWLTTARTLRDSRWTLGLDAGNFASTPMLVQAASAGGKAPVI